MRWLRALAPLLLAGCQLVIGTEDRPVDPIRSGCTLPTEGAAKLRFVHAVPMEGAVDLCVRRAGSEYGRPVLRGGGTECPSGFGYATASAPFAIPDGRIDVKVVSGGSTCSAKALAELPNVDAPKGSSTSLTYLGNAREPHQLRAFREPTERPGAGAIHLRLVNAIAGGPPLEFGLADSPRLPVDVKSKVLTQSLAYPEATHSAMTTSIGRVDANGYLELPKTTLNLAAARAGEKRAILATSISDAEGFRTLYAIGDPSAPLFPVRGLLCDELTVSGRFTSCTPTPLATLSVDTFNVSLYGAAAPEEQARRPKLFEALSTRESDVMCLLQVSRMEDRVELIAKAKASGAFRYSVSSDTNLDTVPTNPRDQSGQIPVRPKHPSCVGTNDPKAVDAALTCLNKCSVTGGPDGKIVNAGCVSATCAGEMITLLAGDADAKRCFNCLVVNIGGGETLGDIRNICTTDPRDPMGFHGQASQLILSRLPIRASETYVLPATSYQRVVQYAEVEIETGKFVDYYCTNFTSAYGDLIAYSGYYSGGATGGEAWLRETQLQAQRTVEYVRSKSGTKFALVSGDWSASRELKTGDGTVIIDASNPKVFEVLEGAFLPAYPKSFTRACTECSSAQNPFNADQNLWASINYMFNFPETSAVEANVLFKEPVVTLSTGGMGPLSRSYLFNSRVLRPY